MKSTLKSVCEKLPVSQEQQQLLSEMDVWEPPFERWIRLAASLLGKVPVRRIFPEPQTLAPLTFPRG